MYRQKTIILKPKLLIAKTFRSAGVKPFVERRESVRNKWETCRAKFRTREGGEGYIFRYIVATFLAQPHHNFRPRIQVPRHLALPSPLPPLEPHLESAAVAAAFSRSPRPSFLSQQRASNHSVGGAIRMLAARVNRGYDLRGM